MDFSQFTGTEQAHMTKVIEKKQVGSLSGFPVRSGDEKRKWRVQKELVRDEERLNQDETRKSGSCGIVSWLDSREKIMDEWIEGEWQLGTTCGCGGSLGVVGDEM